MYKGGVLFHSSFSSLPTQLLSFIHKVNKKKVLGAMRVEGVSKGTPFFFLRVEKRNSSERKLRRNGSHREEEQ